MNIWLGIITFIFILVTAVIIYIKLKKISNVLWSTVLLIIAGTSFWFGYGTRELWLILLCSIIIGACLLVSVIHAYNKLLTSGEKYESVGDTKKPRSFGNGYWH